MRWTQLKNSKYLSCRVAKVQRVQTEIEKADVEKHELNVHSFQETLGQTEENYHHTLSELVSEIKDKKLQDDAKRQTEVTIYYKDCSKLLFVYLFFFLVGSAFLRLYTRVRVASLRNRISLKTSQDWIE